MAIAVLIALTLLPALLGFGGERLRPRGATRRGALASRRRSERSTGRLPRALGPAGDQRCRLLTIVLVVAGLGAMAYPAKDLQIALPSNGVADPGTPARVTYDLISEHFGDGLQRPLIVAGDHRQHRRPARR